MVPHFRLVLHFLFLVKEVFLSFPTLRQASCQKPVGDPYLGEARAVCGQGGRNQAQKPGSCELCGTDAPIVGRGHRAGDGRRSEDGDLRIEKLLRDVLETEIGA